MAKREGVIEKARLGLEVVVIGQKNESVTTEVKRIGYLKDRECPL